MPTILLILTIITPPHQRDIVHQYPQASLEECWENAKAFLAQGMPKNAPPDAQGLAAACAASAEALKADEHS